MRQAGRGRSHQSKGYVSASCCSPRFGGGRIICAAAAAKKETPRKGTFATISYILQSCVRDSFAGRDRLPRRRKEERRTCPANGDDTRTDQQSTRGGAIEGITRS